MSSQSATRTGTVRWSLAAILWFVFGIVGMSFLVAAYKGLGDGNVLLLMAAVAVGSGAFAYLLGRRRQ